MLNKIKSLKEIFYMKDRKTKIKEFKECVQLFLDTASIYDNYNMEINYLMYNPRNEEIKCYASHNGGIDKLYSFWLNTTGNKRYFEEMKPEDYVFDDCIFKYLEKGWKFDSATMKYHNYIWNFLYDNFSEDYKYKKGAKKYMEYCKKNNLNKEYIENATGLKTGDIESLIRKYDKGVEL